MKNKRIIWMLTAGLTFGMLTGCGGEEKKTYDQACADLAQGSYDYALQGYQSSITAGFIRAIRSICSIPCIRSRLCISILRCIRSCIITQFTIT